MLGDIQKGRLDMACGRFRMTADRAHILNFTYPTQFEVNQVYLITDTQKSEDVGFLFRPFSTIVWLLLIITILVVFLIFFVLRAIEFRGKENILKKGTYRLFTPSSDRIPECPQEIPNSKCISIFSEILSRHPPEYGDVTQLNDRDFVSSRIDNHYTPAYPELSLFEKPSKSSFTLNQLSSIFVIHLLGTLFSSLLLIAEIVTAGLTIHRNTDISSKKEETAPKRESENV
uniref:PBPe domain-containing protein n=1 Tax=Caenorhabditis tropicalis TaxID=1561998 RepID=A0A1I7TSM1_9PELO